MPYKIVLYGCLAWGYSLVYGAKYIAGINFEIKGHIPKHAAIIASKHQSAWETAFFWVALKQPCFVLKKELMYIPFLGFYLYRSKQIWLNRNKGASAIKKLLKQTKACLSEDCSIVIFPEGTRTKPGATPNYKPGIATIYANTNAKVIPVRLNSGHFWPRNSFKKIPGTITVEFLPAIPQGLSKQEFMKELEKQIEG